MVLLLQHHSFHHLQQHQHVDVHPFLSHGHEAGGPYHAPGHVQQQGGKVDEPNLQQPSLVFQEQSSTTLLAGLKCPYGLANLQVLLRSCWNGWGWELDGFDQTRCHHTGHWDTGHHLSNSTEVAQSTVRFFETHSIDDLTVCSFKIFVGWALSLLKRENGRMRVGDWDKELECINCLQIKKMSKGCPCPLSSSATSRSWTMLLASNLLLWKVKKFSRTKHYEKDWTYNIIEVNLFLLLHCTI